MPFKNILIAALLLFSPSLWSQDKAVRYFLPIHFNLGASLGSFSTSGTPRIQQKVGTALSLSTGLMMRIRDRSGFTLEGGINYVDYGFNIPTPKGLNEYTLGKYDFKAAIRPFLFIPRKSKEKSWISLQFGAGLHFHSASAMAESKGPFFVVASVPKVTTPFIAPEIGFTQKAKRMQVDIGLTYMYNFSNTNLINIQVSTPSASAVTQAKLNYLGLVVRLSPEIWRNRAVKSKANKPERENRKISKPEISRTENETNHQVEAKLKPDRQQVKLELRKEKLILEVWDNSNIDGDTISIYFNGDPILISFGLRAQRERIELTLKPGENTLLVEALNEGSISPNTAAFILRNGRRKYPVNTITSKRQNELIILNYKP